MQRMNLSPFPSSTFRDLTFCQRLGLGNGAVGVCGSEKVYRLNSLFDPDLSGVGHQPYGYDQLMAIYQRYKVIYCDVEVGFYQPTLSAVGCIQIDGPADGAVLTGFLPETVDERPSGATLFVPEGGAEQKIFRRRVDFQQLIGATKAQFDADAFHWTAAFDANPLRAISLRIAVADATGVLAQNGLTCQMWVKLKFHAQLYARTTVAAS